MHVIPLVTGVSFAHLLTKRVESITLRSFGGQVAGLILCKVCSVYVLHTMAVRNAYFSLQICHGVVDSCQMRKYEPKLTLFRLDPHEQCPSPKWVAAPEDLSHEDHTWRCFQRHIHLLQVLHKLDEKWCVPHTTFWNDLHATRQSRIITAPALAGNPVTLLLPPGVSESFLLLYVHECGT
jgi:hypothetical protein